MCNEIIKPILWKKYYFDGTIKFEDFNFEAILIARKTYENIFIYDILYKTFIGAKPLRISFSKIVGFIKDYNGNRYLVSFDPCK